jgi:hypothetical protein
MMLQHWFKIIFKYVKFMKKFKAQYFVAEPEPQGATEIGGARSVTRCGSGSEDSGSGKGMNQSRSRIYNDVAQRHWRSNENDVTVSFLNFLLKGLVTIIV